MLVEIPEIIITIVFSLIKSILINLGPFSPQKPQKSQVSYQANLAYAFDFGVLSLANVKHLILICAWESKIFDTSHCIPEEVSHFVGLDLGQYTLKPGPGWLGEGRGVFLRNGTGTVCRLSLFLWQEVTYLAANKAHFLFCPLILVTVFHSSGRIPLNVFVAFCYIFWLLLLLIT